MADQEQSPYLVLARKYRPQTFESLIGQDAMVQTLGNAFETGRIHHAYMLTGVRGVGKTTTARILARAFNYVDDKGAHPTLDLSVEGEHCRAIIEGRHVDVIEMDAASNTGVDNIRENIIDSMKYGPASAPYKVFIIDEVHMLSNSSFNALLKTLEEPPPYVKFIFATTEIRKVPVTILSRCQRFDLRRIVPDVMSQYMSKLLEAEKVETNEDALRMIVRAGEGSVRDCLSLLDQAIAHGGGTISADGVRAMLGLADGAGLIDLFEQVMRGQTAEALDKMRDLYDAGADAETILGDLANFTHLVTRLKIVPAAEGDHALTPDEKSRGTEFAQNLGMRELTRAWQILTKGLEETARASNAIQSAEMVLIRLAYAADLPTPDELITKLQNSGQSSASAPAPSSPPPSAGGSPTGSAPSGSGGGFVPRAVAQSAQPHAPQQQAPQSVAPVQQIVLNTYADFVALAGEKRDLIVRHALEANLRPVSFSQGRIEVALTEGADPSIIATLSARLKAWTGQTWLVMVSTQTELAPPTLKETKDLAQKAIEDQAEEDPLVQSIFEHFPGARLVNVTLREDSIPPGDDFENETSGYDDDDELGDD